MFFSIIHMNLVISSLCDLEVFQMSKPITSNGISLLLSSRFPLVRACLNIGRLRRNTSTKWPTILLSHRTLATDHHWSSGTSVRPADHRLPGLAEAGRAGSLCATVRITICVHSFYGRSSVCLCSAVEIKTVKSIMSACNICKNFMYTLSAWKSHL